MLDQETKWPIRCDNGKLRRRGDLSCWSLVGLYILNLLCTRFSKDQVGLYTDDGLAALKLSGPQADRARKDIEGTFKECGLRVTVDILLKQADFLDVALDLPTEKIWPYRKPNNDPLYINA